MPLRHAALILFLILSGTVCAEDADLFVSKDHNAEGLFTGGIEGPAVDKRGNLYAVNFSSEGTIGIIDKLGKAKLFLTLPKGSIANGIRFDREGNMYLADYVGHNILMVPAGTKEVKVFVHEPRMNQPNDLAITVSGTIFASDPNWESGTGQLWKITKDGTTTLLEKNMGTTNGIEVSPDGKHLYVNESVQRRIWRYDIQEDETIANKTLWYQFNDHGLDGMRCDQAGNLYITRYGAGEVAVLVPEGTMKRRIQLKGKKPSNVAFGGPDGKTLYITLQDRGAIETLRVETPGRSYGMW
jgi:sugar lactone lactonase YvrE